MAEFNTINTQEEFEAAVKEKYGDIEDLKGQITTLTGERDGHAETIKNLQGELSNYKTAEMKSKIAKEFGIPEDMANRLTGADEKAMREDAKALKGQLDAHMGADPGKQKGNDGKDGGNGLLSMLRSMKGA